MITINKLKRRAKIKTKIRGKIFGTATKPRFTVFRSNKAIYAQIIDDETGTTLVSHSTMAKGFSATGSKIEISKQVGVELAAKSLSAGITEVVFDRNGFLYHGRIKSLADGAREGGLKF